MEIARITNHVILWMARAQTDVQRATMEPCVKMVSFCELQLKLILRRWCGMRWIIQLKNSFVKDCKTAFWSVRAIVTIQNTLLCCNNVKRHTANQNHLKLILIIFTHYIKTDIQKYINKTIIVWLKTDLCKETWIDKICTDKKTEIMLIS